MNIKGYLAALLLLVTIVVAVADPWWGNKEDLHTPDYYEQAVRNAFRSGEWERGKKVLDKALDVYPDVSPLNELAGRYWYHHRKYDESRFYLMRALRADPENVVAREYLVEVEDKTQHYSTAISLVNELLEGQPYDRGLWTRKIDLYRKQNNIVEADRLLERLYHIYPNDSTIRQRYVLRLEDDYQTLGGKNKSGAIERLQELIRINPNNEGYYYDLTNLQLQQGDENAALSAASQGLARFPRSSRLATKKIGILAQQGRYNEALELAKQSGGGSYDALLMEAARAANQQDPYTLYGRAYERNKGEEALNYLLNTSISRGYDQDALFYISEAKKRRGNTLELSMKEYDVYKRMGNESAADGIIAKMYEQYPDNYDVADEVAARRMARALPMMVDGLHDEAIPLLRGAIAAAREPEVKEAAISRLYVCYLAGEKWADADSTLEMLHRNFPARTDYVGKKADLYARQGRWPEALEFLREVIITTPSEEPVTQYVDAYEEIAVPAIKAMEERGALPAAHDEARRLLDMSPRSRDALALSIGLADRLRLIEEYDSIVARACAAYPEDVAFMVKRAATYNRNQEPERSIDMLRPQLDVLPGDLSLVGAFSASSEQLAYDEMKHRKPKNAVAMLDTALMFDRDNVSLLYAKGVAFEKMKQYDSAYVYQKHYQPSLMEVDDFKKHLSSLRAHSYDYHSKLSLEYLQGRYGAEDIITSVGTLMYTHTGRRNSWSATVNYAGRDGGDTAADQVPGGQGVQLGGSWTHVFSKFWSMEVAGAWGSRYFPMVTASLGVTFYLPHDWELLARGSFRQIDLYKKAFRWDEGVFNEATNHYGSWLFERWDKSSKPLVMLTVGTAKNMDRFRASLRLDGMMFNSKMYVNSVVEGKYFPLDDGVTSVQAMAGIGTAPEASLIDNAMPTSFERLNTMVGLGGRYQLTPALWVGVMGTWHTFYSQTNRRQGTLTAPIDEIVTNYKNLFNIYVNVNVKF